MNTLLYTTVLPGKFIDRPNRFIAHVEVNGQVETCHMPNPGRMRELLFPGCTLYVTPNKNPQSRTAYRVIGVDKGEDTFYLDTSRCNDVAADLLIHQQIPGWENYMLLRREVTMGDSRFDLLLGDRETGEVFPVEVKSCSLSGLHGAMFPDAPTERGRKHLSHLMELGKQGSRAGLLLLVHYGKARWFLPDFHTDPEFANLFREALPWVDWKAAVLQWTPGFTMPCCTGLIPTSKEALDIEMGDRGNYLLVLRLAESKTIEIQGTMCQLPAGYYVWVGRASENLKKQINRYRRVRKTIETPVDALRAVSQWVGAIPICSKEDLTHLAEKNLETFADWIVTAKDIHSTGPWFGFHQNPMHLKAFTQMEEELMINRLDRYFDGK